MTSPASDATRPSLPPFATEAADATERRRHDDLHALVPHVYDELRAIAHRRLAALGRRGAGGTLATTALVHEAYLKLAAGAHGAARPWHDRTHFLAVAAVAMRQILVDHARARATRKRGGADAQVALDEDAAAAADEPARLLAIDDALDRLATVAPRLARLVEMRFYGGMTEQEIADALGVTVRTVQRDWQKARMLLRRALAP